MNRTLMPRTGVGVRPPGCSDILLWEDTTAKELENNGWEWIPSPAGG